MADLGSIGVGRVTYRNEDAVPLGRLLLCCMVFNQQICSLGNQNASEGNPTQPSLEMLSKGLWSFNWPVDNRARTIYVDVKQAANLSPRPRLVLYANSAISVAAATNDAASGTGWVTCSLSFTPSGTGSVKIGWEARYAGQYAQCPTYWDNFREILT